MNDLLTFYTVESLQNFLISSRGERTVGFVPTMGALHRGHLSLVEKAQKMSDLVIISIFVNPTQFNNQEDLDKYPRTLEQDIQLLKSMGNVVIFAPNVKEIYPTWYRPVQVDLGDLANVMEGEFRPGHFDGVVNVVKRLFDIVLPDLAFFGLKDFQQLSVINHMVKALHLKVIVVPCDIVREESGLAYSSRNARLSISEQKEATLIYQTLCEAKARSKSDTIKEVELFVSEMFSKSSLELEYFQIVDPITLQTLKEWTPSAHGCIAAYCGSVRLIDNMPLN